VTSEIESDAVLWRRSRDGDGEAFGLLFDRHSDRVFRHALRFAGTKQDAEDALATAFLTLWRRRRDVRLVNGSVLPWLLATTTNVGLNIARSSRRYRTLLDHLPRSEAAPDPVSLLDAEGRLGVDEPLRAALSGLRDTDRRIVGLVILEGYSLAEAAELIGVSEPAAKVRLHRARERMRVALHGRVLEEIQQIGGTQ
jgi:RNA polymerase sigma-70 factor (ECF subfamily)